MSDGAVMYIILISEYNGDVSPDNVALSSRYEALLTLLLLLHFLQDVTQFRSVKGSKGRIAFDFILLDCLTLKINDAKFLDLLSIFYVTV